jgi:hypothetical protein
MSEELTEAEQKAWDELVEIHGGYDGYEWIFQAGIEYARTPDTSAKVDVEAVARAFFESDKELDSLAFVKESNDERDIRYAKAAIAALQAPRSDNSAVELVEEGLRIVSVPVFNYADRHQFITKAEQWLKNRGE